MKSKAIIIILLISLFVSKAYPQDSFNTWYQYLMSAKLEKKNLTLLSQYRAFDLGLDSRVFLISGYLDFEVAKHIKPAAGIMYLNLESYIDEKKKKLRHEVRPFQQITFDTNIKQLGVSHRFRVEERFIDNPNIFILRLRYLLSLRIPIPLKSNKKLLYGIFKNELRMNVVNDDTFDSDRITVGLGFKLSKKSAIELAYINQLETKRSNQYAYVGFRNSFDWRKKNKIKP